ncbi:MAG: hypothetical protein N3B13_06375 [Deltaproteobacteria bacterium]|nr:hypothetical protein [Deltaproteobacteria bacterium]
MKKLFFLSVVTLFVIYSCSEGSGNGNISDVYDVQILDIIKAGDTGSTDTSEDFTDIVIKDEDIEGDISGYDVGYDTFISDAEDVLNKDAEAPDTAQMDDIRLQDIPEDIFSDTTPPDIITDESLTDVSSDIGDAGYEDTENTDGGTTDLGTKRGLLFSAREKFKTKSSIFFVDPEGGVPVRISPDLSDEFTRPFWAPDGNSFYFESSGKIYKTPFGKFEPIEICAGMDFAVSPDEKLIALNKYVKINDMGEYDYELFIYNLETKKYTQITNFMDQEMENRPSSPSFSPDSKKIMFSLLNPDGAYDVYSSDIFIYDTSTGFLVNITNEAKKIQAKVANRSPEWSADPNRHAYLHILYPESGYYLVDGLSQP